MMKRRLLCILLFSAIGFTAYAHRLNEYLQATTISLSRDSITLNLHLTAGSDVAKSVLTLIDANGDSILSDGEQLEYAQLIVRQMSLDVDNEELPLVIVSRNFPAIAEMVSGTGEILIVVSTKFTSHNTNHTLVLAHHGVQAGVVYLVNCLLPADHSIQITGQNRNADQSFYQLNYTTGNLAGQAVLDQQQSLTKGHDWAVIKTYFVHGVKHILTGYDHLLFLCALVLGAAGLWDLIKIVTAFTIAHSITLTLATYGLAHLPEQLVEPMIAGSIVFVAVQNILRPQQAGGDSRLAIAFFFGLFHGLGFAGGLLEVMHAMPTSLIVFALIGFSLGVEAGNQLVLLPLYVLLQYLKSTRERPEGFYKLAIVTRYGSFAVAIAGLFYFGIDIFNIL